MSEITDECWHKALGKTGHSYPVPDGKPPPQMNIADVTGTHPELFFHTVRKLNPCVAS